MRLTVLRLFVGALLLVAFAGVSALLTHSNANAAPTIVTVNSTANSDDGACTGAPNPGVGNCTLREAINEVNAGNANTIMFHSAVFGYNAKGVINVSAGLGGLPTILQDGVTIDATNRGVILDGDIGGDGDFCNQNPCYSGWNGETPTTGGVIGVIANGNGFSFSLLGGKNFIIRNVEANAIEVDGNGFSLGSVHISGIITREIGDALYEHLDANAIHIFNATAYNDISLTNNDLQADGDPINIEPPLPPPSLGGVAAYPDLGGGGSNAGFVLGGSALAVLLFGAAAWRMRYAVRADIDGEPRA